MDRVLGMRRGFRWDPRPQVRGGTLLVPSQRQAGRNSCFPPGKTALRVFSGENTWVFSPQNSA